MAYNSRSTSKHESELTREYIVKELRKKLPQIWVEKIVGSPFNKGMPDVVFVLDGLGGVIEAKKEGRSPTGLQEMRLRQVASAGGIALCVTFLKSGQIEVANYTLQANTTVVYTAGEVIEALGAGYVLTVAPK